MATTAKYSSDNLLSGQFVLHTLVTDFIAYVDKKVELLLGTQLDTYSSLTKDTLAKSLQRGEDPQFDQLLWSLGCVAEYCLPCLVDTLFDWYNHQLPGANSSCPIQTTCLEKPQRVDLKGKSDARQIDNAVKERFQEFAVELVFCLVLIEILKQIPMHPLPDKQVQNILSEAFNSFRISALPDDTDETSIIAELYAEMIGVVAQTKFLAVQHKFMQELLKNKEPTPNTLIALINGMKYFRVKMYPVEDFETSFRFMQELATYSLDLKNRDVKNALAGLFVEVLVPVAAAVKTEVNVPVLRDFVDSLYPTSLELSKRAKNKPAIFPLVTCLLCVSQKTFFLNNWHIFLDICLSTLKNRDPRLSRVALESLYRLLWVYMVRIKCESNTTTQARLQLIVKNLFPTGSRNVVPKDMPLNIFVKIIQFIASERLDFAMRDIILDLLAISSARIVKPAALYPERMNIALRAFLVVTDNLQQKDGAPPMPSTMNVMPSGNTIRVKKTFLNKTLTEEDARSIGVLQYLKHVQRSFGSILLSLDNQVGVKLLQVNAQFSAKYSKDLISPEQKPKIELFRTCVAALPRLMPHGIPHSDLLNILCRLTVHIDDDLRSRSIIALQAFILDFPGLSEEVVASFLSFVQSQVTDMNYELVNGSLKIAASLLSTWKTSISGNESRILEGLSIVSLHKKTGNQTHNPSSISTSQPCFPYISIINRMEGFAMVYLCHSENQCRKLAFNVLKEVRSLVFALSFGKPHDQSCLDCFDQLCPEVSMKVIKEETFFQKMDFSEAEVILSAGYDKSLSSLIELSSCWSQADGLHPWMLFMIEFVDKFRLLGMCSQALSYCWSDMFMRTSQLQKHIEPFMTNGSKKTTFTISVDTEHILTLYTHYLIFLCRSSLSSVLVKQRQNNETAVPAGTPDWKVRLTRDRKRLDTVPSTLFRNMVEVLKCENFPPTFKESVVLGMGYTSVAAFQDLLIELQHVLSEVNESKKQENVRRRRKREYIRIFLLKLFKSLAVHKVLSKGIYKQVEKLRGSKKISREVIQEYVEDTRSYLELLDKSEMTMVTSFSSQQLNGPLSSSSQTTLYQTAGAIKEEMRIHFADLLIHLIRYYPISSRPNLLKAATKRQLFHLFGSWYDKFAKDYEKMSTSSAQIYARKMLTAQCSVMCCGPIFDGAGLRKNGYLYKFMESILGSTNKLVQHLGQESIVLLLHFNPKILHFNTWVVDKCYTCDDIVARACFLGMAFSYHDTGFCNSIVTMLTLTLLNTTDPDQEVSQVAEHLMEALIAKFVHGNDSGLSSTSCVLSSCISGTPHSSRVGESSAMQNIQSALRVAKALARHHPELTYCILSEIFMRFERANSARQRRLLEIVHLWLWNIQLIPAECDMKLNTDADVMSTQMISTIGWGSKEGTTFILNNVLYLTVYYRRILETEVKMCWSVLCTACQGNLSACLQYLSALYSVNSKDTLRSAIRHAITYVSRTNGCEVLSVLLEQCLRPCPINVTVEPQVGEPYYEVILNKPCSDVESHQTTSLSNMTVEELAESSVNEALPKRENMSTPEAIDFSNDLMPHDIVQKHSSNYGLSIQIPLEGDSSSLHNQDTSDFISIESDKPSHAFFKQTAKLSSSLMSLSKTEASVTLCDELDFTRFNTLSPSQPTDRSNKSGLDSLAKRLFTSKEAISNSLCTPQELTSATSHPSDCMTDCLAQTELLELIMWRKDNRVDSIPPQPLPLHSSSFHLPLHKLVCCDKVAGLMCSSMSCIFLSQIVISQCLDIEWQLHLPIVTLALMMNMDQTVLKEVPFYCRKMFAHIILQIVGKKVPEYLVSPILSYSYEPSGDSLGLYSSFSLLQNQGNEHNPRGMVNPGSSFDVILVESVTELLTDLVCDKSEFWAYEDVSPKTNTLKSIDKLSAFIESFTSIVEGFMPELQFKESLASEAMKFALSTSHNHCACRSLQIFRAIRLPLMPLMFNRLVHCLVGRIAYGADVYVQSLVIEMLLTLLQDCELGFECDNNRNSESVRMNTAPISRHPEFQQLSGVAPRGLTGHHLIDRTDNASTHSSKTSVYSGKQSDMPKTSRKIHAHRRSGSVTLSKKMAVELLNSAPGPSGNIEVASAISTRYASADSSQCDSKLPSYQNRGVTTMHGNAGIVMAGIPANYPEHDYADFGNGTPLVDHERSCSLERYAIFAQMFWISTALLETDYEHEFLLALQLLEKVMVHLPLENSENILHIERHFAQIKWKSFPGIQSLILKGLTSSATSDLAFSLLSYFTMSSHTNLISGNLGQSFGFAMNVVSVLPYMLDCFEDPSSQCLTAAKRIAAVCLERYSQEKKLQHLAHVMLLYADHIYEQSSSIWISVVAKYLHETFPEVIREQIEFLSSMLERGPMSMHFSCIRILYSFLFQSELLISNNPSDILFLHNMLKTVSKMISNSKLWKDALMILKLAVSRSSAIASPTISSPFLQSASFASDGDRITLPGRTLTFKYNISITPLIGRRQADGNCNKRRLNASSPTSYPKSSLAISSWKRPAMSQKRTRERLSSVAQICGKHLVVAANVETEDRTEEKAVNFQDENMVRMAETDSNDGERGDGTAFDDEKEHEETDRGRNIEDIVVLRNFDFLDEFDENGEGFTTGYPKSILTNPDKINIAEDDPDTCNLTPFAIPASVHELEPNPSEENSDVSDVSEQELMSHTSGVLSQSWQDNKSLLTEAGSRELYSSLLTISSTEKTDLPRSSSCDSVETLESISKSDLCNGLPTGEVSLNCDGTPSRDSMKTFQELCENAASVETDNEETSGYSTSTKEEIAMQCQNLPKSTQYTVHLPPNPHAPTSPFKTKRTAPRCIIPVAESPPVTSDITFNLSAVPFGFSTQSVPVIIATKLEQTVDVQGDLSLPDPTDYKDAVYASWKLHIASLSSRNDSLFIAKTFDLFPKLFEILCVDFSDLSKNGCMYFGGQLSKIAEHFSSMVEQLPSQIKCPQCLASKFTLDQIAVKASESIRILCDHLEAFNSKRECAVKCIDTIKEIDIADNTEGSPYGKVAMGHNQLELCRLLYQLHYQLLLLLTCFNQFIKSCIIGSGEDVTEQLEVLKEKVLSIEKTYHTHRDKQDIDLLKDLKSRSVREAEQVLTSTISDEHFHLAIRQLRLLRQLWPPEAFGHVNEPAGDFLAKLFFKHLECQSNNGRIFAILGLEDASNEVCEKLMEVNEQIQFSLESLALNTGDVVKTSTLLKKTHF